MAFYVENLTFWLVNLNISMRYLTFYPLNISKEIDFIY